MKFEIAIVTINESSDVRCMYMVDGSILVNEYDEGSEESDFMFGRFAERMGEKVTNLPVMTAAEFREKFNTTEPLI